MALPQRRRPSAALVVAVLALVVATAGQGYGFAAKKLDGRSIAKKSLPANRVEPDSLGTAQIDETKLGAVPLADDASRLSGVTKAAFMANQVRVVTVLGASVATGTGSDLRSVCTPAERAIGGGGGWVIPSGTMEPTALHAPVTYSAPLVDAAGSPVGWELYGRNESGAARVLRAYALCVPLTP